VIFDTVKWSRAFLQCNEVASRHKCNLASQPTSIRSGQLSIQMLTHCTGQTIAKPFHYACLPSDIFNGSRHNKTALSWLWKGLRARWLLPPVFVNALISKWYKIMSVSQKQCTCV